MLCNLSCHINGQDHLSLDKTHNLIFFSFFFFLVLGGGACRGCLFQMMNGSVSGRSACLSTVVVSRLHAKEEPWPFFTRRDERHRNKFSCLKFAGPRVSW